MSNPTAPHHIMIDVTLATFEKEVLTASKTTPVLINFWAPLNSESKTLSPLLENLETDYAGRFKLVKINSDQEQQLGQAFGIRSLPTCIMMLNGQPVDSFVGDMAESQLKDFLDAHLSQADDEAAPPAEDADLPDTNPEAMAEFLCNAVATDPGNAAVRFDYVKQLLSMGRVDDAKVAFAPVIAQTSVVRRFDSLKQWMNAIDFVASSGHWKRDEAEFDAIIAADKRDFQARFDKARWLMTQLRWT
ncbi:MAG: thioredoxin domain-containing protein, partial [Polaromonas sp.]